MSNDNQYHTSQVAASVQATPLHQPSLFAMRFFKSGEQMTHKMLLALITHIHTYTSLLQ